MSYRLILKQGALALVTGSLLASAAVPAFAQEPIKLTFVRAGDSATVQKVFDPMLRAFEAENPGVTVENIPMGFDEANRRFPLMAATGELPDVVAPPDSLSASLGTDGAFLDLAGKISDDLVADIPTVMWGYPCASGNGVQYGVPANAGALVLWYNTNVFKAAGLDPDKPPRTWDEFVAAAHAIEDKTDADGLGLNGFARNDIMDMFGAMVASRAGEWYWDAEKSSVKVNAGTAEALDFIHSLVADGLTQASPETYNRADTRSLLRDGAVGMTFDGPWIIGSLSKSVDVTSPDSPYRSTRFPGMTDEGATSLNLACYNVSATTKHEEMALKLVEFLSKPDNMLTHAQGYGVVPVRTSVLNSDTFAGQPWNALAAAAAAADTVPAKPGVTNLSLLESTIPNAIQSVLLGKATGMEALQALASEQGWN